MRCKSNLLIARIKDGNDVVQEHIAQYKQSVRVYLLVRCQAAEHVCGADVAFLDERKHIALVEGEGLASESDAERGHRGVAAGDVDLIC
jgi:hypothetical protein